MCDDFHGKFPAPSHDRALIKPKPMRSEAFEAMTRSIRTLEAGAPYFWGLVLVSMLASGCHSNQDRPEVRISRVPDANAGGQEKLDYIKGTVKNARPGQHIVLYAYSGLWWVQPYAARTTTNILPDGSWENSTHLGTEYAALLVDADYIPPARTPALPVVGNGVAAQATVPGRAYFTIDQAFWETWWFRTGCLFLATVTVVVFIRLRMVRLSRELNARFQERLDERTRIARELHDTLLQSLHGLMFQFQAARNMLPRSPENAMHTLDEAIAETEQAIAESRDAIHDLRSQPVFGRDLAPLLETAGEELAAVEDMNQNSPNFRVIVEGEAKKLSPELQDELYRIARELLRNAFRHAQAGQIEAEIRYDTNQLRLRIRDDGKGIDPHVLEKRRRIGHWGLPGVRERAQRIGSQLSFWSQAGTGTEVELTIPAAIAYEDARNGHRLTMLRREPKL